ncbi:MAG TPA: twin-arginine translocation signal domain-containing protein [Verrucomicrobiae bacterium]|nr:twin-arginine translocation signal domain-containing protein [Verrucomicrobiae bacterium]
MREVSRRNFLRKSAAGAALAGAAALRSAPLGLPIGSQTYPHRQRIKDGDLAGLCRDLSGIGVGSIELCSPGYREFAVLSDGKTTRRIIEDHGLKCPSAHFTLSELRNQLEQSITWARDVGMTQMGTASLNGHVENGATTMDVVKRAADEYNKIAETVAKAGMQQFLHDERFEMSKVDDRVTYEVLLEVLDPNLVKMQFQMSAMPAVGDVVAYFNKYPGRFISMHLQGVDLHPAPVASSGGGRGVRSPGVAVGKDGLDWPRIFAAARTGGVKNYFVEQDWDLTLQSVAFLKTVKA